jgi:cellulose synthase/poly-beta-1,6-N-acetylglucosamine synthase-like glycosyltransferase
MINREEQMIKVHEEAFSLFQKKNKDYGDAFAKYGPVGVIMRMGDKISRLQSVSKSGIVLVNDEKIRDTLIDLHNYAAMGVMLLDEGKEIKYDENVEFSVSQESENECQDENESNDQNKPQELEENNDDEDVENIENIKNIKNIKNNNTFIESLILTKEEQNEKIIENINYFLKMSNDVFIVILFYIGFLAFIQEFLSCK